MYCRRVIEYTGIAEGRVQRAQGYRRPVLPGMFGDLINVVPTSRQSPSSRPAGALVGARRLLGDPGRGPGGPRRRHGSRSYRHRCFIEAGSFRNVA
ncbi:MAG: hypothetical protein U5O16_22225, partial [Rhodococcus sp. (in: high G+C Gram-positive bacteria)]|uniref:hypothetical protein n=1 Tax=Rhodococcus sp. TaxID=1831 RepID=UPI002ADB07A0|nr:hypothetical protein [Rhodococcus sp. (in: high G+C Gram-positive bacteria)]